MNADNVIQKLEQIAKNTSSKKSFYITLSSNSTRIITEFPQPINLDRTKDYEMALVNLETYYSFPNIDSTNNNFRYSPDNGTTWIEIDIPEGSYEIDDINSYIQRIMKDNGHYNSTANSYYVTIEPNYNTLKSILIIDNASYRVDFTPTNSIRTVLGFNSQIYTEGYNDSENIVNILSINTLRVTNDIIGGSYTNGVTENIIYSFFPAVGPGFKIIESPHNLIYLPVNRYTISQMITKLVDQTGKLLNLRGEELSIRFHIREA